MTQLRDEIASAIGALMVLRTSTAEIADAVLPIVEREITKVREQIAAAIAQLPVNYGPEWLQNAACGIAWNGARDYDPDDLDRTLAERVRDEPEFLDLYAAAVRRSTREQIAQEIECLPMSDALDYSHAEDRIEAMRADAARVARGES